MKILVIIKTISRHLTDVTSVNPVCTSISFSQAAQISPSRGSPYLFQKDQAVNPGLQVKQSSSWPTLVFWVEESGHEPCHHEHSEPHLQWCIDKRQLNHSKLLTFKIRTHWKTPIHHASTKHPTSQSYIVCGIHHHLLSGSLLDAYTCPQSTQLQGHFPTQPDFIRGGRNLPNIVWLINVGCKWLHYIYEIYKNVYPPGN